MHIWKQYSIHNVATTVPLCWILVRDNILSFSHATRHLPKNTVQTIKMAEFIVLVTNIFFQFQSYDTQLVL